MRFLQILLSHPSIFAVRTDGIPSRCDIGNQATVLCTIGDIHLLLLLQLLNVL